MYVYVVCFVLSMLFCLAVVEAGVGRVDLRLLLGEREVHLCFC